MAGAEGARSRAISRAVRTKARLTSTDCRSPADRGGKGSAGGAPPFRRSRNRARRDAPAGRPAENPARPQRVIVDCPAGGSPLIRGIGVEESEPLLALPKTLVKKFRGDAALAQLDQRPARCAAGKQEGGPGCSPFAPRSIDEEFPRLFKRALDQEPPSGGPFFLSPERKVSLVTSSPTSQGERAANSWR